MLVGVGRHAEEAMLDELAALAETAGASPVARVVQTRSDPDPATFETWLRGVLACPSDPDGVVLSTIHRVKGMEWDRVAVYGVHEGIVPHRLAEDVEEERRVLHVAITRTSHQLWLVSGGKPSPLLAGALPDS